MPYPEFLPGDVFLFEHDDSCISRLICKLSKSPISHAAMYLGEGKIIEEGLPHIGTRPVTKLGKRTVYVRRHTRCNDSGPALRKVARKHLEAGDPYSMGNLVMVGVLLAFNSWKPNAHWAVKNLLSALCMRLAKAIDHRTSPDKHCATCSQLVYEMYEEAGFRLQIAHRDRTTASGEPNLLSQALAWTASGPSPAEEETCSVCKFFETAGRFDVETLCCALLILLGEEEFSAEAAQTCPDTEEDRLEEDLYEELVRFASLLELADSPEKPAPRLDRDGADWGKKPLEHLMSNYAGFVSPGHLFTGCPDLAQEIAVITPRTA